LLQSTYAGPKQSQEAEGASVTRWEAEGNNWRGTYVVPEDGEVNSLLLAAESVGADIKRAPTETETKLTVFTV
jgi:hypothetical protein